MVARGYGNNLTPLSEELVNAPCAITPPAEYHVRTWSLGP